VGAPTCGDLSPGPIVPAAAATLAACHFSGTPETSGHLKKADVLELGGFDSARDSLPGKTAPVVLDNYAAPEPTKIRERLVRHTQARNPQQLLLVAPRR